MKEYIRKYTNIDSAWLDTLVMLKNATITKSRIGMCREVTAYQIKLTNIDQTFLLNPRRKLSPYYACAETLWYMQPTKNINMIKAYAPQYVKFAENGEAHGAYGYRLFGRERNQLKDLIQLLREKPDSRQAILGIWDYHDLSWANSVGDMPCTLSLQFLIRDNKLNLIVTMRSNDAWLGLPYDIFAFTCIQRLVAHALNIEPGWYVHQAGSEHLYEKNWQAADEVLSSYYHYPGYKHNWDTNQHWAYDGWQYYIYQATALEKICRTETIIKPQIFNILTEESFLLDLVLCCYNKWHHEQKRFTWSPILNLAIKQLER